MENEMSEIQSSVEILKEAKFYQFSWIESEGLLRDEGVICGLSGTDATYKVAAIEHYYASKRNYFLSLRTRIEEESAEIKQKEIALKADVERNQEIIEKLTDTWGSATSNIARNGAGLILILLTCISIFFVIYDVIKNQFDKPLPIAMGIYTVGMFGLFTKFSLFYHHEVDKGGSVTIVRQILFEVGLPFAASLYIVIYAYDEIGLTKATVTFLFVFFAFLFSGKLLLSVIALLQTDFSQLKNNSLARKANDLKKIVAKEVISNSLFKVHELENQLSKLKEDLKKIPSIETLNANKETKINIFLSEYHLAKGYRSIGQVQRLMVQCNGIDHG
jgi:ABC-type multidrug transport system fused ATPase/permease subunit